MLTKERKLGLLGLVTLAITERGRLNRTEEAICGLLKLCGVEDTDAETWSGELVFNEGDDAIVATERVLGILELEVESCSE